MKILTIALFSVILITGTIFGTTPLAYADHLTINQLNSEGEVKVDFVIKFRLPAGSVINSAKVCVANTCLVLPTGQVGARVGHFFLPATYPVTAEYSLTLGSPCNFAAGCVANMYLAYPDCNGCGGASTHTATSLALHYFTDVQTDFSTSSIITFPNPHGSDVVDPYPALFDFTVSDSTLSMTWTQKPHKETGELPSSYFITFGTEDPYYYGHADNRVIASNLSGGSSGSFVHAVDVTGFSCYNVNASWVSFGNIISNTKCVTITTLTSPPTPPPPEPIPPPPPSCLEGQILIDGVCQQLVNPKPPVFDFMVTDLTFSMNWTQELHPQTGELPSSYTVYWSPDSIFDLSNPSNILVGSNIMGGDSGSLVLTVSDVGFHCFLVFANWDNFGDIISNVKCINITVPTPDPTPAPIVPPPPPPEPTPTPEITIEEIEQRVSSLETDVTELQLLFDDFVKFVEQALNAFRLELANFFGFS